MALSCDRNHVWVWIRLGVFSVLALPAASALAGTLWGPAEDCLNGVDDDGDLMIDCADSNCVPGYSCLSEAPIGWSGYVLLFAGTPGEEPSCPATFPSPNPFTGVNGISFAPASCGGCACGSATGQTCDLPDTINISNTACGIPGSSERPLSVPSNWNGSCYGPSGYLAGESCEGLPCHVSATAAAPTVAGGSCAPQGGTPTIDPVIWNAAAEGCGDAPLGGGCAAAEVCQPRPPGEPFLAGLCIFKDGDNACPSGPFTERHLFYEDWTDTRDCTDCQCGAPSGSTCNATITVYKDFLPDTCVTSSVTFAAGACANIAGNPNMVGRSAAISPPSQGSCSASGGQAIGTVTPILPTTFCCIPASGIFADGFESGDTSQWFPVVP